MSAYRTRSAGMTALVAVVFTVLFVAIVGGIWALLALLLQWIAAEAFDKDWSFWLCFGIVAFLSLVFGGGGKASSR